MAVFDSGPFLETQPPTAGKRGRAGRPKGASPLPYRHRGLVARPRSQWLIAGRGSAKLPQPFHPNRVRARVGSLGKNFTAACGLQVSIRQRADQLHTSAIGGIVSGFLSGHGSKGKKLD